MLCLSIEIAYRCRFCLAKFEAGVLTNVIPNTSDKRRSVQLQEPAHIDFMSSMNSRCH